MTVWAILFGLLALVFACVLAAGVYLAVAVIRGAIAAVDAAIRWL